MTDVAGAAMGQHLGSFERPTVVVYTHSLLEPSMTFIVSHAQALTRYRPVFAGARRVPGLSLPADRVVTANRGGLGGQIEELMFRRFGKARRMADRLRPFRPTVVHAHFGQSAPAALTLADALDVPLVVTFHGNDATITDEEAARSWRGREYLRGRARVMDRASVIIAVSDFIRSRLVERGYPADKVVTHRNGIDLETFQRAGQGREAVVVFVGRLVEKKGCAYLLRALGRLRASGVPARGVILGDGPLRSELEALARQDGAEVEFKGFLSSTEVRDWLARAAVVAVPSVVAANGDCEGLPTVILEAQAMGTPVVATRHAGNTEGVLEGTTALLVDERDVAGLADALEFFLVNPQAVESFGSAGRRFLEENFDIAVQSRGLERFYDQARHLGGHSAAGANACAA